MVSTGCRRARSWCADPIRSTKPRCWRATPKSSGCCARCKAMRSRSLFVACKPRRSPRPSTMEIRPNDLPRHLARKIEPLYVIHGDEPLLALEAGDEIRSAARRAGCDERDVLVVDSGFKWDAFIAANANLGLFGNRKLIDLRIPSGKPGVAVATALESDVANPNPDNVTLVTLPRLDRATFGSAWFSTLSQIGVTIAVQPIEREALPRWIAARLARQNQRASDEVLTYLAERSEGNLL